MSDEPTGAETANDPKEQMRLALERKKQAHSESVSGGRGKGPDQGKTDTHARGGKREFRRKSG
jgi:hypothetical protein